MDRLDNGCIFGIQVLKHTLFQFYFYYHFLEKISYALPQKTLKKKRNQIHEFCYTVEPTSA